MIRRFAFAVTVLALLVNSGSARAQGTSIAAGAALPVGDMANTAGTAIDIDLQQRTPPVIGSLALRLDITYDHFAGKGGVNNTTFTSQTVSFRGELGTSAYWIAGPGYYQSNATAQIAGHNVSDQRSYLGAQAALGVNIPVFRWEGFLEVCGVKLFTPGPSKIYIPLRFGIRL